VIPIPELDNGTLVVHVVIVHLPVSFVWMWDAQDINLLEQSMACHSTRLTVNDERTSETIDVLRGQMSVVPECPCLIVQRNFVCILVGSRVLESMAVYY
jgi:hypothetical protein